MPYKYAAQKRARRLPKRVIFLLLILTVLIVGGIVMVRHTYESGLGAYSNDQKTVLFTVDKGSSVKDIADKLQQQKLIKSSWALQRYVQSKQLDDKLQAGTYALSPSSDTASIVATLTSGNVARDLVTILPGRRIDQVRADLINAGFTVADVDAALNPAQYADVPVLSYKPATVTTLEGLLWPDSYQKEQATSASTIIRASLTAMGQRLTPEVQAAFAAQGYTTYQGLTIASIVIQEVSKPTDQAQAAQVFYLRLKQGMPMGSDVTARYGAIQAGKSPSLTYDSPYNTLLHGGLPPSPISTISSGALDAATRPASTDYLYFVAGDNGVTYFSHTFAEHEALANQHCHKLCGR